MVSWDFEIRDEQRSTPIIVTDLAYKPGKLQMQVNVYPFTEADYHLLTKGDNKWKTSSLHFLFLTIGQLIIVGSQLADFFFFSGTKPIRWQVLTLVGSAAATLLIYIVSRCIPDEKKQRLEQIRKHLGPT